MKARIREKDVKENGPKEEKRAGGRAGMDGDVWGHDESPSLFFCDIGVDE